MWIADMNLSILGWVREAIIKRVHTVGPGLYNIPAQTKLESRGQEVAAG